MSARRWSRFSVAIALLLQASFAFGQAGQHEGSVEKFAANLPGYKVVEGVGMRVDAEHLCCSGILPRALFFNKSAPYVVFSVQTLESPISDFSQIPIFQLAADEAIVLIGRTPPEAKFFAYQPYLLARFYPPDATPKPIFASLGDTINVSTVKTIGPDPFNRPVVLIFTPDQGTDARVRAALRSAGYPDAIINTLSFPASMLNLGTNPGRDDIFAIVHRLAMFRDDKAGQDYVDEMLSSDVTKRPLRVFRVTPTSSGALKPFPAPPLRIRGTGRSEMDLTPALNQLRQAIVSYWDERGFKATEYHSRHTAYDGNEYIQRIKNTLGDSRDGFYMVAGYMPLWDLKDPEDKLTLGDQDFLVVYGPNHVATGKATYTNVNVYASEAQFSLGSVYSDRFGDSVEAYRKYLGGDFPADQMYTYKFARQDCGTDGFCLKLEAPANCTPYCATEPCPPFVLDSSTILGLFFRNYLEPPTRVGPAASELLYDQVIKFSPK